MKEEWEKKDRRAAHAAEGHGGRARGEAKRKTGEEERVVQGGRRTRRDARGDAGRRQAHMGRARMEAALPATDYSRTKATAGRRHARERTGAHAQTARAVGARGHGAGRARARKLGGERR